MMGFSKDGPLLLFVHAEFGECGRWIATDAIRELESESV